MANLARIGGQVIGAQYRVPNRCKYELFETHTGSNNWSVVDAANGTVSFTLVEGQGIHLHRTNSGRLISGWYTQLVDAQGNVVARIHDMGNGWEVFDGSVGFNLLCTARVCVRGFWMSAIEVFLASNLSREQPDYMVELSWNLWASDCIILHGTERLSEVNVNRHLFGRPKYTVTVNAGSSIALVLLLVMIMEKHLAPEIIQRTADIPRQHFPDHDFPRQHFPDHDFFRRQDVRDLHHRHDHDFHHRHDHDFHHRHDHDFPHRHDSSCTRLCGTSRV